MVDKKTYLYEWETDENDAWSFWGKYRVVGAVGIVIYTEVDLVEVKRILPKDIDAKFGNVPCVLEIYKPDGTSDKSEMWLDIELREDWFEIVNDNGRSIEDILCNEKHIEVTKY